MINKKEFTEIVFDTNRKNISNPVSHYENMKYLYHYYEKAKGPFLNLSDLNIENAKSIMKTIKAESIIFASHRNNKYLNRRKKLEQIARDIFISKGGKPIRCVPHYMVVGKCIWLESWYKNGTFLKIPISSFNLDTISFSYGDLFPTFSDKADNKEYRKQVYTYNEIVEIIKEYGLPQDWNKDGKLGPERYIEVQVWDDSPIKGFVNLNINTDFK